MIILTHRGLEPSNPDPFPESSYEAFENHLNRGFGIEFDLNFAKDGIIVFHDSSLNRITNSKDQRLLKDISIKELKQLKYGKLKQGRIPTLQDVLELITHNNFTLNAMHFKGANQTEDKLDLLISTIKDYKEILNKILIFDIKPETARFLKSKLQELILAPSVAHEYDIKRYNKLVNKTLISIGEAIKYKKEGIYDWVWFDEWDTIDENGKEKTFYTTDNFEKLRNVGYKIALVTPELHATSPGLYGGKAHKHASDKVLFFKRIKEIISLQPDAICTDYPEEVKSYR